MKFTVSKYGTDSSGRPIYMTRYMHRWYERLVARLGFRPVIVQGAFMSRVSGGGASQSAGYHDLGGCLDLRTRDLTDEQARRTVREARRLGAGAWIRDKEHGGMDPHIHLVLGSDKPLSTGAASQWREYVAGGDGLVGSGKDYHWRPSPIVLVPPPWTRAELKVSASEAIKADRLSLAIRRLQLARVRK